MEGTYPWGELGEVMHEDTRAMVKKTLRFGSPEERETIRQMVHFLRAAKHDSLINLEKSL
jgi:hypothetical protein